MLGRVPIRYRAFRAWLTVRWSWSRGSRYGRPPAIPQPPAGSRVTERHGLLGTISSGFALRCSGMPSWRLYSTTRSRPLTNDWGFAQRSPNYLGNTHISRCLRCQRSRSCSRWRFSVQKSVLNTQKISQKFGEKKFFLSVPEVNYVEMFVSIRGVPTWHRDFRAWLTVRWSLNSRDSRYRRPPDIPKTPWGPEGWKITQMGSVS